MKLHLICIQIPLLLTAFFARGQGTLIYDQQSSVDETPWGYALGAVIQQRSPIGQSFTPTLSSMDFIRLNLNDNDPTNGLGATLYVNLHANTINGTILGSTIPVALSNGFTGVVDFRFASPVQVTAGVEYVFQPVVQSGGDLWRTAILTDSANWPGGIAFANGSPWPASDLWFREGIVVPEPSSALLVVVGVGALLFVRRSRQRR